MVTQKIANPAYIQLEWAVRKFEELESSKFEIKLERSWEVIIEVETLQLQHFPTSEKLQIPDFYNYFSN